VVSLVLGSAVLFAALTVVKKTTLLVIFNTVNMCVQISFTHDVAGEKLRR